MIALLATVCALIGLWVTHPHVDSFPFWALLTLAILSFAHVWDVGAAHFHRKNQP